VDQRTFEQTLAALETAPPEDDSGYTTERLISLDPPLAAVVVQDERVRVAGAEITVRGYRPPAQTRAALVWAHGGAFVGGSLEMPEAHWVGLALAARDVAVFSVDYRRALHGITFPIPSDDVYESFRWVRSRLGQTGLSTVPVHLGGASAGGSLAGGVAKRLTRTGSGPASLVLAYPTLHPVLPPMSPDVARALGEVEGQALPDGMFEFTMRHFAGRAGIDDEIAFPANGAVPSGHPPTYVLSAHADPLRDSGEIYARQLGDAGVDVIGEVVPKSRHGFLNEPESESGRTGLDRIAAWLLNGPSAPRS
jgi:acetyl esterase/lipase